MKYTKNIGNKLKLIGFEMVLDSNDIPFGVDDGGHYEIWASGPIEVTVEHSPGKVVQVEITEGRDQLNCKSLEDLKALDRIVNTH